MFKFFIIVLLFVLVSACLFGSRGCESFFPKERVYVESEDEDFKRGKELAESGRDFDAMDVFGRIIRLHPDSSSESNFEIGYLAFKQRNYPLAIYHFNQFLALRPDASRERRERTVGLINSAKKKFLQELLPGRGDAPDSTGISQELEKKYLAVMKQNESLKQEIERLRARLSLAEKSPVSSAPAEGVPETPAAAEPAADVPAPEPANPPPPPVPATHVVVAGDTLSGISKKYYGTPARWKEIYEMNRVTMSSPGALKPGMVLKLPRP